MLAKPLKGFAQLPEAELLYEPKWDGFRCIAFRDGDEVELGSRNGRPLTRYFPEVVDAVRGRLPERCVVDGELVVTGPRGLDFDLLSQRIHPAASRVRMLAESTPAELVCWDLLALDETDLRTEPFARRRASLEEVIGAGPPAGVHLTPITADRAVAADWFARFEGAGLDGVVAKDGGLGYLEDQRVMYKIKHERTAEFVVGGFRWYKADTEAVGSLMLGLYDGDDLVHVGVIGAFPAAQRRALVDVLAPHLLNPGVGAPGLIEPGVGDHPWMRWAQMTEGGGGPGRAGAGGAGAGGGPGGAGAGRVEPAGARSRWNADRDLSFVPVRPVLVVEAAFEHLQGRRIRHTARFRRWRPDREPASCTYDQLDVAPPALLADVFRS